MRTKKSRLVGVRLPITQFEAVEQSGLTISQFIKMAVEEKLAKMEA